MPLTGKITPITVPIGAEEEKRQWAFLTVVGGQRDTYNGVQFNLGPSDSNMSVYIAPAGSLVTEVDGTALRVLDDNIDGIYGSDPVGWGMVGLVEETFQNDVDTVVIGESTVAVPWSEYLKIGAGWYQMASTKGGNEITATRVPELETGTLKLAIKGVTADWVILKGAKGSAFEKCLFRDRRQQRPGSKYPRVGTNSSRARWARARRPRRPRL